MTNVSELSNISNICESKHIAKVSVTNNLRQRKIVRGDTALLLGKYLAQGDKDMVLPVWIKQNCVPSCQKQCSSLLKSM